MMQLCYLILRAPFYMARYHVEQTHGRMLWEGEDKFSRVMTG